MFIGVREDEIGVGFPEAVDLEDADPPAVAAAAALRTIGGAPRLVGHRLATMPQPFRFAWRWRFRPPARRAKLAHEPLRDEKIDASRDLVIGEAEVVQDAQRARGIARVQGAEEDMAAIGGIEGGARGW